MERLWNIMYVKVIFQKRQNLLQKHTFLRLNEVYMPLLVHQNIEVVNEDDDTVQHNWVWLDCVLLNVNESDKTVNVRVLPNSGNNYHPNQIMNHISNFKHSH